MFVPRHSVSGRTDAAARRICGAGAAHVTSAARVTCLSVVLFFEIMLVAASLAITWFALYALYRLITDES